MVLSIIFRKMATIYSECLGSYAQCHIVFYYIWIVNSANLDLIFRGKTIGYENLVFMKVIILENIYN